MAVPLRSTADGTWARVGRWLGWSALVGLALLAFWVRLQGLDQSRVVMDALHPFLRGLAIVRGDAFPWRGAGGDFRFGALQAWSMVPLVALAGGLRSLYGLYALVHALGVPFVGLAGRRLGGWPVGLAAAASYCCWPVLLGHSVHGAQTYLAPVAVAAASWVAVVLLTPPPRVSRARSAGLCMLFGALLALAVHHHPYAIATCAAGAVLLPWVAARRGKLEAGLGALAGLAVLAPMVVDNWLLQRERAASGAGTSLVQDPSMLQETLGDLLMDSAVQSLGTVSPVTGLWPLAVVLLAVPALFLCRRQAPAALPIVAWTTASWAALLVVATVLDYVQPYHLAVVLPLHLVVTGWGVVALLARVPVPARPVVHFFGGTLLVGAFVLASGWVLRSELEGPMAEPAGNLDQLAVVEQAVEALRHDAGARPRVLGVLADTTASRIGDPIAFFMDQWLAGEPDSSFLLIRPPAPEKPMVYVVADLPGSTWLAWEDTPEAIWTMDMPIGTQARVLSFVHVSEARRWLRRGCHLGVDGRHRMAGPWEGLAFMARDFRPYHEELVAWARVCDD